MQIDIAEVIRKSWGTLSRYPGGKLAFSKLVGKIAPYSGSIGAKVLELEPGYCKTELQDRRGVRNHLQSVHAVALVNLGELTSGLAFNLGLPPGARAIVTGLSIQYLKKARGRLLCESRCPTPEAAVEREYEIEARISDEAGETVSVLTARWKVGPSKKA